MARFYSENQKYKKEIVAAEAAAMEGKIGCKWSGQTQMKGTAKEGMKSGDYAWGGLVGEAIDACAAQGYIGKEIITQGRVVRVYRSDSGTAFLDFGAAYPNSCFTAVIFKSSQKNFMENPEDIYEGKMVRVKGKIEEYNGKTEVILKSPSQIEVGIEK